MQLVAPAWCVCGQIHGDEEVQWGIESGFLQASPAFRLHEANVSAMPKGGRSRAEGKAQDHNFQAPSPGIRRMPVKEAVEITSKRVARSSAGAGAV